MHVVHPAIVAALAVAFAPAAALTPTAADPSDALAFFAAALADANGGALPETMTRVTLEVDATGEVVERSEQVPAAATLAALAARFGAAEGSTAPVGNPRGFGYAARPVTTGPSCAGIFATTVTYTKPENFIADPYLSDLVEDTCGDEFGPYASLYGLVRGRIDGFPDASFAYADVTHHAGPAATWGDFTTMEVTGALSWFEGEGPFFGIYMPMFYSNSGTIETW